MPIPKLEEERISVVCIGSLNPAIFHPQWFARMGLIGDADAVEGAAEVKIVSHEVTNVVFCGIDLKCLPERLTLMTRDPARFEQLQDLIIKILEELPHIPLKACGINQHVHYSAGPEQAWEIISAALVPKEPVWKKIFADPTATSLGVRELRQGKYPGSINIDLEPSAKFPPGLFVQSNWHYSLPEDIQVARSCETVRDYIRSEWIAACSQAKIVGQAILDQG